MINNLQNAFLWIRASLRRCMPGCWKRVCPLVKPNWQTMQILFMEHWTSSLSLEEYLSVSNSSTCVWGTWRRHSTVSFGVSYWGVLQALPFSLCTTVAGAMYALPTDIDRLIPGACLRQGYPFSPILLIIFMYRISRSSQVTEGFHFCGLRISTLLGTPT